MTVVFIDASGKTLDDKLEALDFTASADVAAISVGFGGVRNEERAFRDGAFLRGYTKSSKVGTTYRVVRDGGWPAPPQLYVDETTSVIVPALTPTEYAPWAQWALDPQLPIYSASQPDRSGNNRSIGKSSDDFSRNITIRDTRPYPARAIVRPWLSTGSYGSPYAGASLFANPEFTCTIRATYNPWTDLPQCLIGADGCILLGAATVSDRPYHQFYGLSGITASSLAFPRYQEAFYSVRRKTNGTIRFGINGVFEDVASTQPGMIYSRVSIGHSLSYGAGVSNWWLGPVADATAWASYVSDADIIRYSKIALGLP